MPNKEGEITFPVITQFFESPSKLLVSTENVLYFFSSSDSRAHIQKSPDLHVQVGSPLRLSCSVLEPSALPAFVYWYKNDDVLNYNPDVDIEERFRPTTTTTTTTSARPYRSGRRSEFNMNPFMVSDFSKPPSSSSSDDFPDVVSVLSVSESALRTHSGNYTCSPSNARSASVMVHVVDGEFAFFMPIVNKRKIS